jgi:serine/threonine-protein kinase
MPIAIGTQFGSLEITELLGKGGMGEVYRARDLKLKREVAIKILPEEFLRDAGRVSRFQREAEVLASLNHPNIGAIHSLEEANGSRFLVLELVEGDTLADRIRRGALPLDDALHIAKSICEALETAHEKGVVHRDLKPANVKVTPEGKVKVLDFGLAKAMENTPVSGSLSQSPTLSFAGTQAGMILGTAAYMSPEQAKGLNTDQRSDIFSFGAVLFEMVTGRQAFQGDSVSEVLASILAREPDLSLLPPSVNPKIVNLLRRALEKNPKRRWHAIGDVRVELETLLADPQGTLLQATPVAALKPLWKRALPVITAIVLTAALTSAGIRYFKPAVSLPITRFPVTLAEGQQFTNPGRLFVAVSRDGSQMVYVANLRLYHRAMAELEARAIPGSEVWAATVNPVFSPDGRSLAFYAASDNTLKKIAVSGGASVTLCPVESNVYGMSWGEDGIVFGQGSRGIFKISENGGKPELLVKAEAGELAGSPQILPGGKALLYTISTGGGAEAWDKGQIFVQSLKPGGARKPIIQGGADGRYVSTGHIVYAFGGTLFAVPFDLGRLQVTGGHVPVVEGVRRSGATGSAQFSFSDTGSLIYIPGPVSATTGSDRVLATISLQSGQAGPSGIERLKAPPKGYGFPRVSPDGKQVAVSTDDAKDTNVWIVDLAGATAPRQLTLGGANQFPVWAGGDRVAFQSDREGDAGIFWQKADGTGTAERLTKPEKGIAHIPDSWSPDGKWLAYTAVKGTEYSMWVLSLQDKKATVFAEKAGTRIGRAAFSPDGHWLAYQSNETGTNQIFVQPFPATGAKYPVVEGGHPFWSPDGQTIILNPGAGLIGTVSIKTRPPFSFGPLVQLPGGTSGLFGRNPANEPRMWDITNDGKRILGVSNQSIGDATSSSGTPAAPSIQVVLNWFEDLKQRMTTR